MPQVFKDVLTEVFIRLLEANPNFNIHETITAIDEYFDPKNDVGYGPDLKFGAYAGDSLLYVAQKGENTTAIRQAMFGYTRVKLLERLIKKMGYDIRETFAILENYSVADDDDRILSHGIKSEVDVYYQNLRERIALPQLAEEVMIRLLHTYPELSAKDVAQRLKSVLVMSVEEKQQYPLGNNYLYLEMLSAKMQMGASVLNVLIDNPDFLQAVDKLKTLKYDTREIFTMIDTHGYHKMAELNANKIATLDVTLEQMRVLAHCLDAIMEYFVVHTDCREANGTDVLSSSNFPTGQAALDRAFNKIRDEMVSSTPVYTSFLNQTAALFDTFRTLDITAYHLELISPSMMARLIRDNDANYKYNFGWHSNYPFISPATMKKLLDSGVSCPELLTAERCVEENPFARDYPRLTDTEILLNHTSPEQQAIVRANRANAENQSLGLTGLALNSSTGLLVSALAIDNARHSDDFRYGFLLFTFMVFCIGLVTYRHADAIINYCPNLNLFGKKPKRDNGTSIELSQHIPSKGESERSSLLLKGNGLG